MTNHSSRTEGQAKEDTFKAQLDKMPGPGHASKLRVTGTVVFNGGGFETSLKKAESIGINPNILILEVVDRKDSDFTKPILQIDVQYEENDAPDYKQVTVRSAGPEFTIDVLVTH